MPTVTLVRPEQVCPATVSTVFCTPQTLLHLHPTKHSYVSEGHIFVFKLIHTTSYNYTYKKTRTYENSIHTQRIQ